LSEKLKYVMIVYRVERLLDRGG